jgi:hypothetical protein
MTFFGELKDTFNFGDTPESEGFEIMRERSYEDNIATTDIGWVLEQCFGTILTETISEQPEIPQVAKPEPVYTSADEIPTNLVDMQQFSAQQETVAMPVIEEGALDPEVIRRQIEEVRSSLEAA